LSFLKDTFSVLTMPRDQQCHAQILTTVGQFVAKSRLVRKIGNGLFELLLFGVKDLLGLFRMSVIPVKPAESVPGLDQLSAVASLFWILAGQAFQHGDAFFIGLLSFVNVPDRFGNVSDFTGSRCRQVALLGFIAVQISEALKIIDKFLQ